MVLLSLGRRNVCAVTSNAPQGTLQMVSGRTPWRRVVPWAIGDVQPPPRQSQTAMHGRENYDVYVKGVPLPGPKNIS